MSYDLVVFEPSAAPRQQDSFLQWYKDQERWAEPHFYDDPSDVTSPNLAAWFSEIIKLFPPMNGLLQSDDMDDTHTTDYYSRGSHVVYAAFAWSQAEAAYQEVRRLAAKHHVGFFDVSGNSDIIFPTS